MSLPRLLTLATCSFALLFPGVAAAALEVEFSSTPLFSETGILPGDAVTRTVVVTNTGVQAEPVEFDFTNVVDGPLADYLELAVDDGTTLWVNDAFVDLFSAGAFPLGELGPNASRQYTFTAALPPTAPDPLQNEQFGFDLIIGFSTGPQLSDRPSARSTSGGTRTLVLFNERATVNSGVGGTFVTWNSSRPASTYLICGNRANGPFTLSEVGPLFGYEFSVPESSETAQRHGQALTELAPGEYECRPAGREETRDGFTIGDPVRFSVPTPPPGLVAGASTSTDPAEIQRLLTAIMDEVRPRGSVLGMSGKGVGNLSYDEYRAETERLLAANTVASDTATNDRLALNGAEGERSSDRTGTAPVGGGWGSSEFLFLGLIILLCVGFLWRAAKV